MEAEKAIEILKRIRMVSNFGFSHEEIDEVFKLAIKALESATDINDSRKWIPVSERLPEESGEYFVWYDFGDDAEEGCMVVNFDAEMDAFGYWHDEYDSFTLGFLDSDFLEFKTAIAWMPLPEPYKGE